MQTLQQLPMPPQSGLLGHVSELKKPDIHRQMLAWIEEYGNTFRIKLGMKDVLVLADPAQIKTVLKERPEQFRRIKSIESVFEEAGLNGIFSADGERWKHQRKLTEPMFQPSHLKSFYPKLAEITCRLESRFAMLAQVGEVVELVDEFKRYTIDVTSLLAFGEDFNAIDKGETPLSASLRDVFPTINQRIKSPVPLWRFFKTSKDKQFEQSLNEVKRFVSSCIEKQRNALSDKPELADAPENMLQVMLSEQRQDPTLTDKEIVANAVTLLLAGEDTTANTLAWMAYLVSYDSVTSGQLNTELNEHAYETLPWPIPRLPITTAIMYEAMRLKPVAPQIYMESLEDNVVSGITLKKGTPIFCMLHASGFNPELFSQPKTFDPNRWLERGGASFSQLQPFGGGTRLCPGRSLAMMEIKLAFNALFKKFTIEPQQAAEEVIEQFAFTMSPVGFNVKVKLREQSKPKPVKSEEALSR
ncbi:cytochrome P450 [Veronia nyctiphanis]|uniref:Cytochrome P450 n=1 Tax=Veronia nyctiphanis TaxID=1278244 RepID=A0A4Q0YLH0_9GAMM|nr:cytochrome P450 [Veronia nyctiphanis]RXJ71526.1 cytochrome P450 [Veronia nyctiphanis]